jgi:hypothetical protein
MECDLAIIILLLTFLDKVQDISKIKTKVFDTNILIKCLSI